MAIKINSNGQSLAAQRQVAQTSDSLGRVFERLSSGQRINRASDDAAGLAIADTLNVKSRVFTTGVRNLNDGISLLSVADAAVSSLTDITVRLKELAEQSSNGVYSAKQRTALDNEAQALSKEFTRITQSTTFNGLNLFDGSVQGLRLQAGFGTEGGISSSLGGVKGTGELESTPSVDLNITPNVLTTADLNGDGIIDFIATDGNGGGDDNASVLLGNGDGTFRAATTIITGASPADVSTGDFNGDGIIDIAIADVGLSIFLGRGDGSFADRVSTAVGNFVNNISSGDLNGDGITDLVTSESNDGDIGIYFGRGDGTFLDRTTLAVGGYAQSVKLGDLNNDGILDIAVTDDEVSIFLGNGNGTFRTRTVASLSAHALSLTIADLNGDGVKDLVTADADHNSVTVAIGRGNGTYLTATSMATGSRPQSVVVGDLNGDGVMDIVTNDYYQSALSVFIGKGNGTYETRTTVSTGTNPSSIAAADFNGDSVLDVISSDYEDSTATILLGKTQNGIGSINQFSLKTQSDSLQSMGILNNKLKSLSAQRGQIGAFQSRITAAIDLLQSSAENFQAAESRIRDTDVAQDAAELTRLQILQQAGGAVLGQANLQPRLALLLLE